MSDYQGIAAYIAFFGKRMFVWCGVDPAQIQGKTSCHKLF